MAYVLSIDAAATVLVLASTLTGTPATTDQRLWCAALAAAAIVHAELFKRSERLHKAGAPEAVLVTTDATWIFAAVVLLPLPLVAVVVATGLVHRRLRVAHHAAPHRVLFSTSVTVLAAGLAALILSTAGIAPDQPLLNVGQVAVVLAAVGVYDLAGFGLILPAILMTRPGRPRHALRGTGADHGYECAAAALGALLAFLLASQPVLVPLLVLQLIILRQAALLPTTRRLAQRDGKTGLLNATCWTHLAERELARAHRLHQPAGLLMLDVDHFKILNDHYGHLAGDTALRTIATTITRHIRVDDLAGRFGGEEFVILLRDITPADLADLAETLRTQVAHQPITFPSTTGVPEQTTLTISIGGCHTTNPASTLPELILTADTALFDAKDTGRNRTHLVTTQPNRPQRR